MGFMVMATTITDTQVNLESGDLIGVNNISSPTGTNVSFITDVTFRRNITILDVLFLDNDYQLSPGQSKILRRNNADGAVFGIANDIPGANVIHHLRGDITAERWRISSGLFVFEDGLDSSILTINATNGNVTFNNLIGTGNAYVCVHANGTLYRNNTECA